MNFVPNLCLHWPKGCVHVVFVYWHRPVKICRMLPFEILDLEHRPRRFVRPGVIHFLDNFEFITKPDIGHRKIITIDVLFGCSRLNLHNALLSLNCTLLTSRLERWKYSSESKLDTNVLEQRIHVHEALTRYLRPSKPWHGTLESI